MRLNDREVDGEKVLFIEEIQSDWNAEGRSKGIKTDKHQVDGVPAAPFIANSNWQNLTMKRIMRMAAEEGYDRVSWVNGKQTADRYSLDKQIDSIGYQKRGELFNITVFGHNGNKIYQNQSASVDDVTRTVGKEIAKRLTKGVGDTEQGITYLTGNNLKVEATWARNLYDKIIPSWIKKFAKKYDAQVETVYLKTRIDGYYPEALSINNNEDGKWFVCQNENLKNPAENQPVDGKLFEDFDDASRYRSSIFEKTEQGLTPQLSLAVTDSMRAEIMTGLPLFSINDSDDSDDQLTDNSCCPAM